MLAIRLQRTGRKGHAQFRMIVQDSRRTPTSGRVVAQIGHYNPHAKTSVVDKEKAAFYLEHGAQPTPRVISILKSEKVALPAWVVEPAPKTRAIRNLDKLRRNRPAEPEAPAAEEKVSEPEAPAEETDQPSAEKEAPLTEAASQASTDSTEEKAE
jgi:small subunit ribosomal protein S16